ncbi:MAG: cytochrome B [Alphaproteobacteria bacterium HGW-Alphaproteobacteria-8]|jgi:cytochrome b|nr:MAG: cytochrome B [Alphaproteobacteria bacterium HGW-Alphaproteobacteria-8]
MASLAGNPAPYPRVRVWDAGVRLFHWSLVAMVTAAWVFDEPRSLHRSFGYVVVALISFRLVWGLIGTRHARFASFIPGPRRLLGYLRDMVQGREERHLGHNPAGAAMIVALLTTLAAIATTGYMMGMDAYFGVEWVEKAHKALVNGLLALVALHLGGVITTSLRHRENLVLAMITGEKDTDQPHGRL